MTSPFPGMDPYLEDSELWSGFHQKLAVEISNQLNQYIGPKYYADVETHTATDEIGISLPRHDVYPDVGVFKPHQSSGSIAEVVMAPPAPIERTILTTTIKLRAVKVYLTKTGQLVTTIEILSPYNKRGQGLQAYREKRNRLLKSPVHLVELDLLRGGTRPGPELVEPPLESDYLLLVNRTYEEVFTEGALRTSEIWDLALNQPFPLLPIPLLKPDPDVVLNLQRAMAAIYQRSGYDWRIDYRRPIPAPKLRPTIKTWLQKTLPNVATERADGASLSEG